MKKFIELSILAAGMVAFGGACTMELQDEPVAPTENKVTITASFPEVTKVSMSEDTEALKLAWEESDYLTIVCGEQAERYELVSIENNVATFAGNPLEGELFDIVLSRYDDYMGRSYKGQKQSSVNSLDHLQYDAVLKGVNTYDAVSFTSAWAEAKGGNLYQNGCLCLHFQMPSDAGLIKSITLSTEENIFFATNSAEGERMNALTLELDNADMQDDNIIKAYIMTSMQEAVIPAETELTLTVVSDCGTWTKAFTPGESTLKAGMRNVIKLNKNNWTVPAGYGTGTITTAAQWNEFAAYLNSEERDTDKGWFVDGVAKIGADIEGDLASINELPEGRVVDGNGNTITRANATAALFGTVAGEVKNLTLAGSFTATASQGDAPLASELAGGTISGCTNEMTITFDKSDHAYVAGIVKKMTGGTIENCVNKGSISVKLGNEKGNKNVGFGGIVGQIDGAGADMLVKDCRNTAAITFAPVIASTDDGSAACGVGGIAGWMRRASSFTFDNCDNEGDVTYSAENITSVEGAATYPICVGGIVGVGSNYGGTAIDKVENGINISMSGCDNTGTVYNCGTVNTTNKASGKRAFTGGLAGFLLGQDGNHATISSCTNTGAVYSYDLTGDKASTMPYFSSVVGGLVGFGGYLDMDKCTVNCEIGCKKRALMSLGGVIGFTVRPFTLTESNVHISGYYNRIENYQNNRAIVASVPTYYGGNTNNPMTITPDIKGSKISNCNVGGHLYTTSSALSTNVGKSTADLSGSDFSVTLFNSQKKVDEGMVCGQGIVLAEGDLTVENVTYWNGK